MSLGDWREGECLEERACGWMGREIPEGRVHVGDKKGMGMPGERLLVGDGRKGECLEDGCMWKMGKEG